MGVNFIDAEVTGITVHANKVQEAMVLGREFRMTKVEVHNIIMIQT